MSGNGHGFHSPPIFDIITVQLGNDCRQSNPLIRADIFQSHGQLQNASRRFHAEVARIEFDSILAAFERYVDRFGTCLGIYI